MLSAGAGSSIIRSGSPAAPPADIPCGRNACRCSQTFFIKRRPVPRSPFLLLCPGGKNTALPDAGRPPERCSPGARTAGAWRRIGSKSRSYANGSAEAWAGFLTFGSRNRPALPENQSSPPAPSVPSYRTYGPALQSAVRCKAHGSRRHPPALPPWQQSPEL